MYVFNYYPKLANIQYNLWHVAQGILIKRQGEALIADKWAGKFNMPH